jgi:hypothetical protein
VIEKGGPWPTWADDGTIRQFVADALEKLGRCPQLPRSRDEAVAELAAVLDMFNLHVRPWPVRLLVIADESAGIQWIGELEWRARGGWSSRAPLEQYLRLVN